MAGAGSCILAAMEKHVAPTSSDLEGQPVRKRGEFGGVLLCFALSGFAALVYQTAWLRQFSVVFGTSELAVATVVAAHMGGLALGAAVGGRFIDAVRRPVLVYGLLELGIALGALLVPTGLRLAQSLQVSWLGQQPELMNSGGLEQTAFYFGAALVVILVPTTLMGATLPLLTRHAVQKDSQIGSRVGMLYAINTGGAVLGTLVAAFLLLPALGLAKTVYVGAGTNALVFVVAAWLSRGSSAYAAPRDEAASHSPGASMVAWRILPLIALSGFTSFAYEILWTRLLSQVVGGSIFAFAITLATFLVGITLGSAFAAMCSRTKRMAVVGFAFAQIGIALASMLIWEQLNELPEQFAALEGGISQHLMAGSWLVAKLLLPATLCIGATFPFALRILADGAQGAARASARVYAWNTVGAIAGASVAGFFLIPSLGLEAMAKWMVGGNLALACLCVWLLGAPRVLRLLVPSLALVALLMFSPSLPMTLLRSSYIGAPAGGELLHLAVGRSATVLAVEEAGVLGIRSNGLPEAGVASRGAMPYGLLGPQYLALLPLVARPAATKMMVIGFGGGGTVEFLPPSIQQVDVIELEPEIVRANELFSSRRRVDPLADPRVRVTYNDARGALALTQKSWGIIVSQPSHPWTAGASHLYTREFLELAKGHLTSEGVFVQWMNASFLNEELFASLGATLLSAFDHVRLYRPNESMLVFLASDGALDVELDLATTGLPVAEHPAWWAQVGINGVNDMFAMLALEQSALEWICQGAPVSTDDANLLAMNAIQAGHDTESDWLAGVLSPHDPLVCSDRGLLDTLAESLDPVYLVRRMAYANLLPRAIQYLNQLPARSAGRLRAQGNLESSLVGGQWAAGSRKLHAAFTLEPENQMGRFLALRENLPYIAQGLPGTENLQAMAEGLQGPALQVYRGWQALAQERWQDLSQMDSVFEQISPRDVCFNSSARLRAEWRIHMARQQSEPSLAVEALELLEMALVHEPAPFLTVLRAEAAQVAQRPDYFIESMNMLSEFVGPRSASLPRPVVLILAEHLARLEPYLAELGADDRTQSPRLRFVSGQVSQVLAALND